VTHKQVVSNHDIPASASS